MILSVNESFNIITFDSTIVGNFIASPASYTKLEITVTQDCTTSVTKTYTSSSPITGSGDIRTTAGVETIHPSIFSSETFANGVYGVVAKLTALSGSVTKDMSCLFIDNGDIRCGIDATCLEQQMTYYWLQNAQSCSCNCSSLCEALSSIIEYKDSSCECK